MLCGLHLELFFLQLGDCLVELLSVELLVEMFRHFCVWNVIGKEIRMVLFDVVLVSLELCAVIGGAADAGKRSSEDFGFVGMRFKHPLNSDSVDVCDWVCGFVGGCVRTVFQNASSPSVFVRLS